MGQWRQKGGPFALPCGGHPKRLEGSEVQRKPLWTGRAKAFGEDRMHTGIASLFFWRLSKEAEVARQGSVRISQL